MSGSPKPSLTIHELHGDWSRQLRSAVSSWGGEIQETRTWDDLNLRISRQGSPLLIISLARKGKAMLGDLILARASSPDALILVLNSPTDPFDPGLIRELGATHVLSHAILPPRVVSILKTWVPLAAARLEHVGWTPGASVTNDLARPWYEPWMGEWA